jgi:hypothetical protein
MPVDTPKDDAPVIVSDIDGTVLDVSGRIEAVLNEIGVPYSGNPLRVADTLRSKQRSRFYSLFLSERYTHLDKPVPEVIAALRDLQNESGLPLVMLSGRPIWMKRSTMAALDAMGLPIEAVLLRPKSRQMQRTADFKVETLQERRYRPRYAYDDDDVILAAFASAYPEAVLIKVTGPQTTPWPD